ncbi:uncharacterized protein [Dermacentor albipictus]|uniref:uncharacterized protein isoform X2 n=1 Tax=Dermacentor albipictus TaxID=60249 RepID=UPI0038FCDF3C
MSKRRRGNEERPLRDVFSAGRTGLPAEKTSEMPTATSDPNVPEHNTLSAKLVTHIQDAPLDLAEPDKSALQCSPSQSKVMPQSAPNLVVSQSVFSDRRGLIAADHEKDCTPSKYTDQTKPVTSGVQVARGRKRSSLVGKPAEPVQDKPPVLGDPVKKVPPHSLSGYDELSKPRFSTGVVKDDSAGHQNLSADREEIFVHPGSADLAAPMTNGTRDLHETERDPQVPKLLESVRDMPPVLEEPMNKVSGRSIAQDNVLPKPGHSGVSESDSPGLKSPLGGKETSVCPGSVYLVPSMTSLSREVQGTQLQGPKLLEPAIDMSPLLGQPTRKASGSSSGPRDSELALPRRFSGPPKSDSPERQSFLDGKEKTCVRPGLVDLAAPTISGTQLHGTEQGSQVPRLLQPAMDMSPVPEEPVKRASQCSLSQGKGILKPRRSSGLTKGDAPYQQCPVAVNQDDAGSHARPIPKAALGPHGKLQELECSPRTSDPLPATLNASNSLLVCKNKQVSIDPIASFDLFTPTLTPPAMITSPQGASCTEWGSAASDLHRRLSDMPTKSSSIQPQFGSGMSAEQNPADLDSTASKPWIRRQALAVRSAVMSRPPWASPDRLRFHVPHIVWSPVKSLPGKQSPTRPRTTPPTQKVGSSMLSWPLRLKHRFPRLVMAAIMVPVLALFATLLLFMANRVPNPKVVDRDVCRTSDCVQHAQEILRRMNPSANPCHDFHGYVCGSTGTARYVFNQPRPVRIAREQGRELVAALNHSATTFSLASTSAAAVKALRALHACLERRTTDAAGLFADFMRERGIPWPAPSSGTLLKRVQVLDVIMDLVVSWRAALWFDVRVEYSGLDGSPVVAIGEAGPLALYRMEQLSDLDEHACAETVRAMAAFLAGGQTNLTDADVHQLLSDESPIRKALLSPEDPDDYDSTISAGALYEQLRGSVLNDVTIGEWAAFLERHMNFNLSSDPRVLLTNERRLQAVASLFGNLPPSRLLDVIGWTLAYTYAWTVNPALDVIGARNGSAADDHLTTLVLCFLTVHESYGIAQVAPFFPDVFPTEQRVAVEAVVTRTAEALTGLLRSSGRLADRTMAQAAMKIEEQSAMHPWPLKAFLRLEILDLLYSEFPLESASFFATWVESRKALKNSLHNRYYGAFMLVRYRWRHSRVQYLYSLNQLRLGLAIVFPPSHLRHGSQSMTYAGLGFQLARQLVRIVDKRGRTLDYDGRPFSWWHEIAGSSRLAAPRVPPVDCDQPARASRRSRPVRPGRRPGGHGRRRQGEPLSAQAPAPGSDERGADVLRQLLQPLLRPPAAPSRPLHVQSGHQRLRIRHRLQLPSISWQRSTVSVRLIRSAVTARQTVRSLRVSL